MHSLKRIIGHHRLGLGFETLPLSQDSEWGRNRKPIAQGNEATKTERSWKKMEFSKNAMAKRVVLPWCGWHHYVLVRGAFSFEEWSTDPCTLFLPWCRWFALLGKFLSVCLFTVFLRQVCIILYILLYIYTYIYCIHSMTYYFQFCPHYSKILCAFLIDALTRLSNKRKAIIPYLHDMYWILCSLQSGCVQSWMFFILLSR